jgi:hypothetical protein
MDDVLKCTIADASDAMAWIDYLHQRGWLFHFEDSVDSIGWDCEVPPTEEECVALEERRQELWLYEMDNSGWGAYLDLWGYSGAKIGIYVLVDGVLYYAEDDGTATMDEPYRP